jgi:adenylate cyclase
MLAPIANECITIAAEHKMPTWHGYGTLSRGWAIAENGDLAEGLRQLSLGMEVLKQLNTTFLRTCSLAMSAELMNRIGHRDLALSTIREAHADALRLEERMWLAEIHRIEGELMDAHLASAEDCFHRAVMVARVF